VKVTFGRASEIPRSGAAAHWQTAVIVVLRRVLVSVGIAAVAVWTTAVPVSAAPVSAAPGGSSRAGEVSFTPRAGEWWFTTWKILPKVWPLTQGAGVTVAVLDSGVQASVPDLRGAVVPGGDVTGSHTNGERDFNTIGDGHGTQMAVLIAGQGHGTGMVGIAPEAKILPVTVTGSAADRTASPGSVAAGIIYAANHGARVIDISQVFPSSSASGCDTAEQAAVSYAISRDIVVVAAEGSSNLIGNQPSEPASCAGVLAVGAIQHNRSLWPDDVPEPYLTVVAAGAGLISSGRDGKIVPESGARSASALVAGAAALIRSRYPSMPWNQVIQRLIGTALPEGGRTPNQAFGFGIVRLSEVVNATAFPVPASTPNPVYAKYLAWLGTQQGTRQGAPTAPRPSPARSAKTRSHPVSRAVLIATIVGAVLVMAAVIAVLVADAKRRPKRRRRPAAARPSSFGYEVPLPGPRDPAPGTRIFFGDDPRAENPPMPPRIPPYSPVPQPREVPSSDPLVSDGDYYFPDGGNP
jgi:subtilisin family serine protease